MSQPADLSPKISTDEAGTDEAGSPLALLKPHRRLVIACFLGWFLDAFDQVAIILVLSEVGRHFGVSLVAMGLVITAQSIGRVFGNIGWGWLADRYGRKLTFMLGVVWFAAFSGMSGLAWSYAALIVIQFLFGIGFGGEWTASAALLMETVPRCFCRISAGARSSSSAWRLRCSRSSSGRASRKVRSGCARSGTVPLLAHHQ